MFKHPLSQENLKALLLGVFILPLIFLANFARGDTIDQSKSYQAVMTLSDQFADDLQNYSSKAKVVSIISFSQTKAYEVDLSSYLIFNMEQSLSKKRTIIGESKKGIEKTEVKTTIQPLKFVRCIGCFQTRALTDGNDVFIRKGFIDNDEMKDSLTRLGADAYITAHLDSNGDEAILQISLFNSKTQKLLYSSEYKTPMHGPSRSGFVMGVGLQSATFHDSKLPGLMGARLTFGQRLVGLGDIGLGITFFDQKAGYPSQTTFSLFTDLNRDEIKNQRSKYVSWIFPVDFGVTDFNGDIQFQAQAGFKLRIGSVLYVGVTERQHFFLTKPKNSGEVKDTESPKALFKSDNPISGAMVFGVGLDFTF